MISLITATANAATTLGDNLESVAQQGVPVEQIIVDNMSVDDTVSVAEQYSHVARIICEPDAGMYDAMNKGLRAATGDIVGILNADDWYAHEGVLSDVLRAFEDPAVDACYGDLQYVRGGQIVRHWRSGSFRRRSFYWGWMPPHPTFFLRRRHYERHGGFRLDLGSAADYELMLRMLLRHRLRAAYIPRVLVHMRPGGTSNASIANRLQANRNDRRAWTVNSLRPYPWTIVAKPLRKLPQYLEPRLSALGRNLRHRP